MLQIVLGILYWCLYFRSIKKVLTKTKKGHVHNFRNIQVAKQKATLKKHPKKTF